MQLLLDYLEGYDILISKENPILKLRPSQIAEFLSGKEDALATIQKEEFYLLNTLSSMLRAYLNIPNKSNESVVNKAVTRLVLSLLGKKRHLKKAFVDRDLIVFSDFGEDVLAMMSTLVLWAKGNSEEIEKTFLSIKSPATLMLREIKRDQYLSESESPDGRK